MDPQRELYIFKTFVETSGLGHGFSDLDGKIIYLNTAFCRMLGEEKTEDVLGKNIIFYYPEDAKKKLLDEILPIVRHEGTWYGELPLKSCQGHVIHATQNLTLITDKQNNPLYFANVVTDITGLKQVERELRHQKDLAENYLNVVKVMIIGINAAKEVMLVNKKGCETLGYEREEIIGKNWFDHFLPERIKAQVNRVADELLTGKVQPAEYYENPILTKAGEERIIAWHNIVLKNEEGKISCLLSSGEDITERVKIQEKIVQERDFSDSVLNSLPGIFYLFDQEGTFLRWNKNFEKISEYSSAEIGKMNPLEFFAGPDKVSVGENIRKVFAKGSTSVEAVFITKSGRKLLYYFNGQKIKAEGKECLVGMGMDITKQKRVEDELRRAMQEKETLLREVHHRVKNNLLTLYSLVNLQKIALDGDQRAKIVLEDTKQRISAMGRVHRMLYLTKDFSELDFSKYIISLVEEIKATHCTSERTIEVVLDLEPVILDIDAAIPCGLIVNELLVNAFRYAFPQRDKGVIQVGLKSNDGNIELQISDNGIGMDGDPLSGESKTLGLRLVTMLSQQLKGKITYNGQRGSLFTIIFKSATI